MSFEYSPYILPLLVASFVSAVVVIYTWMRRSAKGALGLFVLSLAVLVWTAGSLMEIAGADLETKYVWGVITFIGIAFVPYGWLIFSVVYSGQGRIISRRFFALTALIPSTTVLLALTTRWHGLVWSEYHIVRQDDFSTLAVSHGFWFFIHSAYSYLLILTGTVLLIRVLWRRREALYRRQIVAMLIGVLAPWISNAVYLTGNSPIPYLDLTPFAFTISATAGAWAILGFRLVDIIPIARDLVVDSMREGMIVLDAQNRIVDLNTAAERIIGLTASEAIGQPAAHVFPSRPDLVERYRDEMSVHEEIDLGEGESPRTYDLRISSLCDQRDRIIGRLIFARDVTERKRAEEALERRATQLATLNRIGRHVASILDRQELLQRAVNAVRDDLGYRQAAVLFKSEEERELYVAAATDNFWEAIPDGYRQPVGKGAIGIAVETGETVLVRDAESDPRVYRVGDWLSPSSLSVPIRVGGRVIGVLEVEADVTSAFDESDVVVLDIMSEQIGVAIQNARLYEQAQQEITERKRAEEALVQARDQAMEASRLKSRLLANVSHDLRSPLGSILGFTEMLQEGIYGPLSERQRTATAEITDSTERLLSFVNNLLGQAQIESGKVVFNFEPFDPAKLLEAIPSTARTLAKYKGLELTGEVAPDMPATPSGDLYWLRQIVFNLIDNAVKFTDQGKVEMRIYQVDEDYWAIQVSDTGCGIPAEARSYVFEPFQQVDETATSKQQTGSGLGLSIVKQLTTMMGGEVMLTSEVGQGSTFTVLLPLEPVQEETI